jgi:DNA excision repair protein ERCC-2
MSLREFALPSPRRGSIDALSGYGATTLEGIEIHQQVQRMRQKMDPRYQAEKAISGCFELESVTLEISGRMDGFVDLETPLIEEIKSSTNLWALVERLEADSEHPYVLQLRTYGYLYWKATSIEPDLSFHLVSTRKAESRDLFVKLDRKSYDSWLKVRLHELEQHVLDARKREERRKRAGKCIEFPFLEPRSGQLELVSRIDESISKGERLLLQAPTGMGKTAGVLYPVLRSTLRRAKPTLYLTPKNSQHSVAEDAAVRFREAGVDLRSLTVTSKSKLCMKDEPLCDPKYCEFARDHYTKVQQSDLIKKLSKKKHLGPRVFKKMAEEFEVCPFELQLMSAALSDLIICDYNYVFSPGHTLLNRVDSWVGFGEGKPSLIIDEVHNLPARAMEIFSSALSTRALEKMSEEIDRVRPAFRGEFLEILSECQETLLSAAPEDLKPARVELDAEPFFEQEERLRNFLQRYLEAPEELRPRDPVLRLFFSWGSFTEALSQLEQGDRDEFFASFVPWGQGGTLKVTCCDASALIQPAYEPFGHVVGFSATLKPFKYYAKLTGLESESLATAEYDSPFDPKKRKILLIPQVSTKYTNREKSAPKVAEVIRRIAELKVGNYFAFFPSFEFLEKTLLHFTPPQGFQLLKQEREMSPALTDEILNQLDTGMPTIVFAVQGGVFSEGVDYPGDRLIGAFVVGPPLPQFNLEREEMKKYYDKHYQAGFDYAYAFPAMSKAVQAAGRVIRTESDCGLIVLLDPRFTLPSYSQSMPSDWFGDSPRELVSQSIVEDVRKFWERQAKVPKISKAQQTHADDSEEHLDPPES